MAPGDLTVIMGVQVDKARRDQFAAGVDLFLAFAEHPANFHDAAVSDRDIRFEQVAAESVGDVAAADHKVWIVGHGVPSRDASYFAASWVVLPCCQPSGMRLRVASAVRRRWRDQFAGRAR
jgi:hypothetical protein